VTTGRRPLLALVQNDKSVSTMQLAESAAEVCDLAWVFDSSEMRGSTPRLLRKLGTVLDIAGMTTDEAVRALEPLRPDGIIAYADPLILTTSALATGLGLDYHDTVTAERLTDKFAQRRALRDAGLPVPFFVVVPAHPTPADVDTVVAGVDFPVVLKPRSGAGSRDTLLAGDASELRTLLAELAAPDGGTGSPMIVEEYLVGASPGPSSLFADYLSVESFVCAGKVNHVAVTGRFPLAEPFRETGFVLPSDLGPNDTRDVLDVASGAISALGVHIGFLHTEIKLTPAGPRVIEVNGRMGGHVPEMLARAAGVDVFAWSMRIALGESVVLDGLLPTHRVGYFLSEQAPQWASRVVSVTGLDRLVEHPDVDAIFLNRRPGDDVDWRKGSQEYVFSTVGAAADHHGVLAVQRFIDENITMTFA
jgi:hypothetical protein